MKRTAVPGGAMLLVLAALAWYPPPAAGRVKTGLDVLVEQHFAPLRGKRVGLITNQTGQTYDGRRNIDLFAQAGGVKLVAIFAPEHGIRGVEAAGANIASSVDPATGLPVYSLYNRGQYRPAPEMLAGIDTLVYDIQDVGTRYFTYITTLGYTLEAAARNKIAYYVLDRPNPLNGVAVEGPLLDPKYRSFVGYTRMPIRYGMTPGELARMYNGELKLGADLHVVAMEGWRRRMWFDETGLPWVNPSPNLRNLTAAILYPATCLPGSYQITGRGTDTPFVIVGAPWFKGLEVADYLNGRKLPGVRFLARRFRPTERPYKDQDCDGVDIQLIDRDRFDAVRTGLELLAATLKFHPGKFDLKPIMNVLGKDEVVELLKQGKTGAEVNRSFQGDVKVFRKMRARYLLYR